MSIPTNTTVVCQSLPPAGIYVGVAMGVLGSIGINIGQNLQASGLRLLSLQDRTKRPWKSRKWIFGMSMFILFSLI